MSAKYRGKYFKMSRFFWVAIIYIIYTPILPVEHYWVLLFSFRAWAAGCSPWTVPTPPSRECSWEPGSTHNNCLEKKIVLQFSAVCGPGPVRQKNVNFCFGEILNPSKRAPRGPRDQLLDPPPPHTETFYMSNGRARELSYEITSELLQEWRIAPQGSYLMKYIRNSCFRKGA